MNEFLVSFRQDIEKLWDEKTCSPKFLPIDINNPAAGQCAPTSKLLLDELHMQYPERRFSHAIGKVYKNDEIVIDYHLWVVELCESPKDTIVIDVTGDQSGTLPKVICNNIVKLLDEGICYVAYDISDTSEFMHGESIVRAQILKERYATR